MDTVLHYLSTRMDYNKKLQKATHLVVDEAQVVSEKPGSADMLNNAVITFRKFGGIVPGDAERGGSSGQQKDGRAIPELFL